MSQSNWTREQQISALMRLPWTIKVERDEIGNEFVARVAEMPDAIATGETMKVLSIDLYESLKASIECRLDFGDPLTLPKNQPAPWDIGERPPPPLKRTVRIARRVIGGLVLEPTGT